MLQSNILNISNYILERGWLRTRYKQNNAWLFNGWATEIIGTNKQLNLEVSDSNTYNALIELANLSNMHLRFDYINQKVIFVDKESLTLDKNYTIKRDFNLQNMGLTYNGENMYSIFYVDGAEDEFGFTTLLSEETSYLDNFLFDFNYFKDRSLLSSNDYNTVVGKLNNELKEINKNLKQTIREKYTQIGLINDSWNKINNLAEILAAPTQFENYTQTYLDFNSEFYRPTIGTKEVSSEENFLLLNILVKDLPTTLSLPATSTATPDYPIVFTYWGKQYKALNSNIVELTQGVRVRFYLQNGSGRNPMPVSGRWYTVYVEGSSTGTLDFDLTRLKLVSIAGRFQINQTLNSLPYIYPLFNLLFNYDGQNQINLYYKKVTDAIDSFTADKELDEEEIQCINPYNGPYTEPNSCAKFNIPEDSDARLARDLFLKERLLDYPNVIGEILENGTGYYPGKYTVIKDAFIKYNATYTAPTLAATIMDRHRTAVLAKQNFWYDLKTQRQHIFTEGYYENGIETNSESLLEQTQVIYQDYKKPLEDFTITYIDISDIIGLNIEDISPGDFITLREDMLEIQDTPTSKLKVANISRTLRDKANISLEIYRYSLINNILEKIVAKNRK